MFISKITLGTAQLGLNYGIANVIGKPNFQSSNEILKYSWENGINTFDTSPVYGDSEEILGLFISLNNLSNSEDLVVISKLPRIKNRENIVFDNLYLSIKKQITESLKRLNLQKFPIYLIHHAPDIFLEDGIIIECLTQIKKEGLIDKIGISIYNPEEVKVSLKFKNINVFQVPINIFDHRLIKSKLLKKLKKRGYIIFARSIYLQGLFFTSPEKLPKNLEVAKKPLKKLRNLIKDYQIDIAKLALLFVRDLPEITSIVIGAEKVEQVANNINLLKEKPLSNEIRQKILDEFSDLSEDIINPSYWNKSNKKKNKL